MRRQFEFSVDSFQITLDPLLDVEKLDDINESMHITAESMFGDFPQALRHLNRRLIETRSPEEIRGGGLLKYCHLLTRGYSATPNCRELERYMCSRFFIDFPDIATQEMKLRGYMDSHWGNDEEVSVFDYHHFEVVWPLRRLKVVGIDVISMLPISAFATPHSGPHVNLLVTALQNEICLCGRVRCSS